jgi:hypothetical protein
MLSRKMILLKLFEESLVVQPRESEEPSEHSELTEKQRLKIHGKQGT